MHKYLAFASALACALVLSACVTSTHETCVNDDCHATRIILP